MNNVNFNETQAISTFLSFDDMASLRATDRTLRKFLTKVFMQKVQSKGAHHHEEVFYIKSAVDRMGSERTETIKALVMANRALFQSFGEKDLNEQLAWPFFTDNERESKRAGFEKIQEFGQTEGRTHESGCRRRIARQSVGWMVWDTIILIEDLGSHSTDWKGRLRLTEKSIDKTTQAVADELKQNCKKASIYAVATLATLGMVLTYTT